MPDRGLSLSSVLRVSDHGAPERRGKARGWAAPPVGACVARGLAKLLARLVTCTLVGWSWGRIGGPGHAWGIG
jgi:hypothetical protein